MVLYCFVATVEVRSDLRVELLVEVLQHLTSCEVFKHVDNRMVFFFFAKFDFFLGGLICFKVFYRRFRGFFCGALFSFGDGR